jgi:hypothetical protein
VKVSKQLLLSVVATGLLIAPAWARPVPAVSWDQPQQAPAQPAPNQPAPDATATSSASGKIVAATDTSLSLEIQQGSDPSTQQFVINSETKVDGKLAVGAMATVAFRTDNGTQIATQITVQSGS